ncbi:MAG: hydrolase, partial [Propionibacteriaceae bacterium]|nr:hydrolase [Propionibacteriaceae bacterium]
MSQNGLHYATDRYDIARYERMRQIAAEVLGIIAAAETGAGPSAEDFHRSLLDERGHATPKVDVRAALFDRNERVLLVQEA